jgi:hypothetical protein
MSLVFRRVLSAVVQGVKITGPETNHRPCRNGSVEDAAYDYVLAVIYLRQRLEGVCEKIPNRANGMKSRTM